MGLSGRREEIRGERCLYVHDEEGGVHFAFLQQVIT